MSETREKAAAMREPEIRNRSSATCIRCEGQRWICEDHDDQPWGSPHMADDMMALIACGHCRNKTFTLTEDQPGGFPLMRCSACGQHMGRMGYVHDDDGGTT